MTHQIGLERRGMGEAWRGGQRIQKEGQIRVVTGCRHSLTKKKGKRQVARKETTCRWYGSGLRGHGKRGTEKDGKKKSDDLL